MRLASLFLLFAALLPGQLLVETPTGFQPVGVSVVLGSSNPGDPLDTRFRGPAAANVQVGGTGFSARDILPSGEFTVRFLPSSEGSFSANLTVGSTSVILRATALASIVVSSGGVALSRGAVVDFGVIEVGLEAEQSLLLENRSSRPLSVNRIETAARILEGPALPLTLGPGQSTPLRLGLTPTAMGFLEQPLTIDGREFTLRATGTIPRLPAARIVSSVETPQSGQQVRLRIELAEAARVTSGGTLELEFSGEDPAVRLSTGRTATFSVPAGARVARFGETEEIMMQTGTVGGSIRLRLRAAGNETERAFQIPWQAVVVDEARATREGSTVVVSLTGFDNSRNNRTSLNFQFFDKTGAAMGAPFTIVPENEWTSYYQTSGMGGVFRLRAVFPVAGDVSLVGSVTTTIANTIGRTEVGKLTLP